MWQTHWRQKLKQQLGVVFSWLVSYELAQDNLKKALSYVRQWTILDPYNEAAHRQMMQLYCEAGQRPLALQHYLTFNQTLTTELGLTPEAKTTALYDSIRSSRPSQTIVRQPILTQTQPGFHLPVPLTRFIGRETEIKEIVERLDKPHCRLLTISGPGGIGKSRLAVELGRVLLPLFPDGVHFVPLAPLEDPELIVSTIADILNIQFYGNESNKSQLLNYLRE